MSIIEQIRKLDEQKATLLAQAKQEALAKANEGIKALAELGFDYRLVQGDGSPTPSTATGSRRTGIRDQVLAVIQQSTGMARADLLKALDAVGDKKAEQSISNALAALKKGGILTADNGVYVAV